MLQAYDHPIHVIVATKLGAHIATLPPKFIRKMVTHYLTDIGVQQFLADWE